MRRMAALLLFSCLLLTACNKENPGSLPSSPEVSSSSSSSNVFQGDEETTASQDDNEETTASHDGDGETMPSQYGDDSNLNGDDSEATPSDEGVSDVTNPKNGSLKGSVSRSDGSSQEPETPSTRNFLDAQTGGYDKEAAAVRSSILGTKDSLKIKGTTYYISPKGDDDNDGLTPETAWKSLEAYEINRYMIEPGDAILLERNGVYRPYSTINAKSGVTYGAYGEGEKPQIYGSVMNYAQSGLWEPSNKKNIWKMKFPQKDAGVVVFNYEEWVGVKRDGLITMTKNGEYSHNLTEAMLYLYCDKGNPGDVFESIEIGTLGSLITIHTNGSDITIDNISLKYIGGHGIDAHKNNHNITITNCVVAWIGGSIQPGSTTNRYGNGIQFWDSCSNICVENNYIYQIYDAALTFQYRGTVSGAGEYDNISFSKNLIEYSAYSIEFFASGPSTHIRDVSLNNNIMRFAGYGFPSQRPLFENVSDICAWDTDLAGDRMARFNIKNNVFDCSANQAVDWRHKQDYAGRLLVSGNTFYQKTPLDNPVMDIKGGPRVMNMSPSGYKYATNQTQLETAIKSFDSSPKLIKWLG